MNHDYHPPGDYSDDADLLTRIGIAMTLRGIRSWQTIRVDVHHGEVTLHGRALSDADRRAVVIILSHLAGVRRVVDKTSLAKAALPVKADSNNRIGNRRPARRFRLPSAVRAWFFLMLLGAVAGCSEQATNRVQTYPVSGSITLKGQPLPGAFVALHPKSPQPDVPSPRASIGSDGSLKVSTYDGGDGAPEGEYVVTVEWFKPIKSGGDLIAGPNVVPKKYSSPRTSDIIIRVAAQENVLPPITL